MDEQIAGQAFAVIGEAAPAEESRRVKRPLRRAHQKSIPVDGLLAGVRRNRINPCATRRVAVRRSLDVEHVAKRPRRIDSPRLLIDDGTHALAAHLQDAISLAHRLNHGEAVLHGMRHRLFAVHVLARGARIHHNAAMLVVGDGHNHRVHIFAIENLVIIARCRNLLLHGLLTRFMPAVIEIADRDAFDARHRERCLQQLASARACADRSKSNPVARRYGRGPRPTARPAPAE